MSMKDMTVGHYDYHPVGLDGIDLRGHLVKRDGEEDEDFKNSVKDFREALEIFAAEIWDNKYEPDKIGCTVERWCGMPGNDLIRKYRDRLYKRPIAIENLKRKK